MAAVAMQLVLENIVSEYDQEIPQSQTADNPMACEEEPLNHHESTRKTN